MFATNLSISAVSRRRRGGAGVATPPYDSLASAIVIALSFDRLLTSYTGPLFEITRESDSATLDCDSTAEAEAFLNGTPGLVSKIYDQVTGTAATYTAGSTPYFVKFGGRWGACSKGTTISPPNTNWARFSGRPGLSASSISGIHNPTSGVSDFIRMSTGTSSSNNRLLLRKAIGFGVDPAVQVAGRRADANSTTTLNSAVGIVDAAALLVCLDYLNGPLRLWINGVLDTENLTYYGAGGNCSATTPLSLATILQDGSSTHEMVWYDTALLGAGERDIINNRHLSYFSPRDRVADAVYTGNHPNMYDAGAGITVVGGVSRNGRQKLVEFDNTTKRVVGQAQFYLGSNTDDHAPATFMITPGGKAFTCFARHNQVASIVYGRGTTNRVNSITTNSKSVSSTTAYAQSFVVGTDIYMLTRANDKWVVFKSTDDGATFGSEMQLATFTEQFYVGVRPIGGNIVRLFSQNNSDSATNGLYVAEWDVSTGDIVSGGVTLANMISAPTTPSNRASWAKIINPGGAGYMSTYSYSLDGSAILYAYHGVQRQNGEYYFAKLTGADQYNPAHWTRTKVVDTGDPIGTNNFIHRGDIVKHSGLTNPRLYLTVNTGTSVAIQQWDAGNTSGTSWSLTQTIATKTLGAYENVIMRPYACWGGSGAIPVMWVDGYFLEYYDYMTELRIPT